MALPKSFRSSSTFATIVVVTAVFSDAFLFDLVIPAMPQILMRRVGVSEDEVQLWTSILLAVYGGSLLFSSILAASYTTRSTSKTAPFVFSLLLMAGSILMFFIGTSLPVLLISRIFQGASAGFVWTSGITVLNIVLGPEEVGIAMGWVSAGLCAGEVVGPVVGGVVYDYAGHWAVFTVGISIVAIDIVLRLLLVDAKIDEKEPSDQQTETSPLLENAPPINDCPTPRRSIYKILFTDREYLTSLLVIISTGTFRSALESTLPIYLQTTFSWGSTGSGFVILLLIAPSVLGPWVGHFTTLHGPRMISTIALLFICPFLIILGLANSFSLEFRATEALFCILILGIGFSIFFSFVPHMVAIAVVADRSGQVLSQQNAEDGKKGGGGPSAEAYAGMNAGYAGGMIGGPLLAAALKENLGWDWMCGSFGLLGIVIACFTVTAWRDWNVERKDESTIDC